MRMPRIRFTVRRMMLAVAIIAAALGLEVGRRRRADLLAVAAEHASQGRRCLDEAEASRDLAETSRAGGERSRRRSFWGKLAAPAYGLVGGQLDREATRSREEAAYHAKMREKYEHAANFPWLRVEPDPPMPE